MESERIVVELPKPMPASNECLPHAAMILGNPRGAGLRPPPAMVSRLVIQHDPKLDVWCLVRLDEAGGYVGDSWHPSRQDALHQARREFGEDVMNFARQEHAPE